MKFKLAIKHSIDFLISLILLILCSPLFLIVALVIKLESRGPVFFKQERIGKNGKTFVIYKFRSMVNNADKIGKGVNLSKDDDRITAFGHFIRNWSIDELPQLINILIGDMSIIGPRPTIIHQVERYSERQRKRLNMRPGVTGWAQVNGRNSLPWVKRIEYDIWYVENYSLLLDLKIFIKTFRVALLREGLYGQDGVNDDFDVTTTEPDNEKEQKETV